MTAFQREPAECGHQPTTTPGPSLRRKGMDDGIARKAYCSLTSTTGRIVVVRINPDGHGAIVVVILGWSRGCGQRGAEEYRGIGNEGSIVMQFG